MAEGLAHHLFAQRNIDATVTSAGTFYIEGYPADPHAVMALASMGIDLRGHRSKGAKREVLGDCDLVWVMSPDHESCLQVYFPDLQPRLRRMWEWSGDSPPLTEIRDPLGGDLSDFERCRDLLLKCLENWLDQQGDPS